MHELAKKALEVYRLRKQAAIKQSYDLQRSLWSNMTNPNKPKPVPSVEQKITTPTDAQIAQDFTAKKIEYAKANPLSESSKDLATRKENMKNIISKNEGTVKSPSTSLITAGADLKEPLAKK